MKRFMCLTFAALLCLVCLLPLRASASSDYDLAYDATDRMDSAFMNQLGTQTFYRLKTRIFYQHKARTQFPGRHPKISTTSQ